MKKTFLVIGSMLMLGSCTHFKDMFGHEDKGQVVEQDNSTYVKELPYGKVVDRNSQSLYEVTASDTLASIADLYDVSQSAIIEMNNLQEPYTLRPGMIIKVPTIKTIVRSNKEEDASNGQKVIIIKPSEKTK